MKAVGIWPFDHARAAVQISGTQAGRLKSNGTASGMAGVGEPAVDGGETAFVSSTEILIQSDHRQRSAVTLTTWARPGAYRAPLFLPIKRADGLTRGHGLSYPQISGAKTDRDRDTRV